MDRCTNTAGWCGRRNGFHVAVQWSGDLVSHVCNPENFPACLQAASCLPQPAMLGDLDTNLRGRTAFQLSAFHICNNATKFTFTKYYIQSSLQLVIFYMDNKHWMSNARTHTTKPTYSFCDDYTSENTVLHYTKSRKVCGSESKLVWNQYVIKWVVLCETRWWW